MGKSYLLCARKWLAKETPPEKRGTLFGWVVTALLSGMVFGANRERTGSLGIRFPGDIGCRSAPFYRVFVTDIFAVDTLPRGLENWPVF